MSLVVGRFGRGSLWLIIVPVLSLIVLWAFTANITLSDALNLQAVSSLQQSVGNPTDGVVTALQQERRATAVYLGSGGRQNDMGPKRSGTDQRVAAFRRSIAGVGNSASSALKQRLRQLDQSLRQLTVERTAIDTGRDNRPGAIANYNNLVDEAFRVYGSMTLLNDPSIAKQSRNLVTLTRAREILSREDAMVAGGLAAGQFTTAEHTQIVQLVGAQRMLYADTISELSSGSQQAYQQVNQSPEYRKYRSLEDTLVVQAGSRTTVNGTEWQSAVGSVMDQFRTTVEITGADEAAREAGPVGIGILLRLVLGGLFGLFAVIASLYLSIRVSRSLMRQLKELQQAALQLANRRLPRVIDRLRKGENVDVNAEAPPLPVGKDQIGQVGEAFNSVQHTAIATAVEQAELRAGVNNVFLNIARRSQTLLYRLLAQLDVMERKAAGAAELRDLFTVDHMATRMRRNAENLMILGGASPGRQWSRPVDLVDVLRSAASESEHYTRVRVVCPDSVKLAGSAVSDVAHLLAELIDNATAFSPPHTQVQVRGQLVPNGFVVEIEDRGLGMNEKELAAANEWLSNPPEFNVLALSDNARLGMFVVARIASRYNIKVSLQLSPFGGTTAIALIPAALVTRPPRDMHEVVVPAGDIGVRGGGVAVPGSDWHALAQVAMDTSPEPRPFTVVNNDTEPARPTIEPTPGPPTAGRGAGIPALPAPSSPAPTSPAPTSPVPTGGAASKNLSAPPAARRPSHSELTDRPGRPQPVERREPRPSPGAHRAPVGQDDRSDQRHPPVPAADSTDAPKEYFGLPVRVRQASLAPELRRDRPQPAPSNDESAGNTRSPEEIRQIMTAYQRGTVTARALAQPSVHPLDRPAEDSAAGPAGERTAAPDRYLDGRSKGDA